MYTRTRKQCDTQTRRPTKHVDNKVVHGKWQLKNWISQVWKPSTSPRPKAEEILVGLLRVRPNERFDCSIRTTNDCWCDDSVQVHFTRARWSSRFPMFAWKRPRVKREAGAGPHAGSPVALPGGRERERQLVPRVPCCCSCCAVVPGDNLNILYTRHNKGEAAACRSTFQCVCRNGTIVLTSLGRCIPTRHVITALQRQQHSRV